MKSLCALNDNIAKNIKRIAMLKNTRRSITLNHNLKMWIHGFGPIF